MHAAGAGAPSLTTTAGVISRGASETSAPVAAVTGSRSAASDTATD